MPTRIAAALLLAFSLIASPAIAFTFVDSQGKTHDLKSYKGKWVLINFWATWCPPCLEEIPDLIALYDERKNKDLAIIGVALQYQNPKTVLEFADSMFINYPVVLGTPKSAAQVGPIRALPTSYLYNREGKLVAYRAGAITREEIETYINKRR